MISMMIAAAAPVLIGNCVPADGVLTCDATNASDTPVAVIAYRLTAHEAGRSVPWLTIESGLTPVPGGIEPGETIDVRLDRVPPQSDAWEVTVQAAYGLDAEPIDGFDETPVAKLNDALSEALNP